MAVIKIVETANNIGGNYINVATYNVVSDPMVLTSNVVIANGSTVQITENFSKAIYTATVLTP